MSSTGLPSQQQSGNHTHSIHPGPAGPPFDSTSFYQLFQSSDNTMDAAPANTPADIWNPDRSQGQPRPFPHVNQPPSVSRAPLNGEFPAAGTPPFGHPQNNDLAASASGTSISAPPSAQRHSTSRLLTLKNQQRVAGTAAATTTPTSGNLPGPTNSVGSVLHQNQSLWSNTSFSSPSIDDPITSNQNSLNVSRSSRFFPSPADSNRVYNPELDPISNTSIFNRSPLLHPDTRRSTFPLASNSNSTSNILNLDNSFNSQSATPLYDSPNSSYFNFLPNNPPNKNSTSYSTVFEDELNNSLSNDNNLNLSNQFTTYSSTPIHHRPSRNSASNPTLNQNLNSKFKSDLMDSTPNLDPMMNLKMNINPLNIHSQYHTNNGTMNNMNTNILNINNLNLNPTSSFVDNDLENDLDSNFDINELAEISFSNNHNNSPSPSPSPSSSFRKGHGFAVKSLNFSSNTTQQPLHRSSFPTLDLSNLKKTSLISIDSPHTPINQQNLSELMFKQQNRNHREKEDINSAVKTTTRDVTNEYQINSNTLSMFEDHENSISPSSSSFPSPSIPYVELASNIDCNDDLSLKEEYSLNDSNNIETKSRVLHFINHVITRHDIIYRSYIVSVPSHSSLRCLKDLIHSVFYPLGMIKSVNRVNSSLPIIETIENNDSHFNKYRVIVAIANSQLTTNSGPNSFNSQNNGINKDQKAQHRHQQNQPQQQQLQSLPASPPGPWKTIKYRLEDKDVKMLIFYEKENTDFTLLNDFHDLIDDIELTEHFNNNNGIFDQSIESVIKNSQSSMSSSLTTNNKLDVCWYPEGFSSTFHRRGVNNFMFVRELQSKMIVNRTRVSGGGIIEMGEFRISMPIEEMGFVNHSSGNSTTTNTTANTGTSYSTNISGNNSGNTKNSGEKLKRSFLVNIDLKELDGKTTSNSENDKPAYSNTNKHNSHANNRSAMNTNANAKSNENENTATVINTATNIPHSNNTENIAAKKEKSANSNNNNNSDTNENSYNRRSSNGHYGYHNGRNNFHGTNDYNQDNANGNSSGSHSGTHATRGRYKKRGGYNSNRRGRGRGA